MAEQGTSWPSTLNQQTEPLTIESLQEAIQKVEETDLRMPVKVVNPLEKCSECGKTAKYHNRDELNAHLNSIPGMWQ